LAVQTFYTMKGLIVAPAVACLAGATLSCSYRGPSTALATDIVNQRGEPITRATIVPLASERSGLGVGPDSAGPETDLVVFVGTPFLWDSGGGLILSAITQSAPPDNHLLGFKVHHLRM
jgi:hypothetical protein